MFEKKTVLIEDTRAAEWVSEVDAIKNPSLAFTSRSFKADAADTKIKRHKTKKCLRNSRVEISIACFNPIRSLKLICPS